MLNLLKAPMAKEYYTPLSSHSGTLLRFGIVGGTTYLLTILTFYLLNDLSKTGHNLSATGAYFIGVAFHFTMNRKFTFQVRKGSLFNQLAKYAILAAANYLLTLTLFELFLHFMHETPTIPFALSVAVTTATGYLIMRYWIFPPPPLDKRFKENTL